MPPKTRAAEQRFKLQGRVKVYSFSKDFTFAQYEQMRDLQPSKLATFLHDEGDNLAVNAGLDQACNLLLGINTNSFTHCGVGSSNTAAAAGQTALVSQLGSRNTVTSRYLVSTGAAHFDTFFASGDAAGTWQETGLFTASVSGTMLARRVISSFVKSASNTAVVAWTITLVAV